MGGKDRGKILDALAEEAKMVDRPRIEGRTTVGFLDESESRRHRPGLPGDFQRVVRPALFDHGVQRGHGGPQNAVSGILHVDAFPGLGVIPVVVSIDGGIASAKSQLEEATPIHIKRCGGEGTDSDPAEPEDAAGGEALAAIHDDLPAGDRGPGRRQSVVEVSLEEAFAIDDGDGIRDVAGGTCGVEGTQAIVVLVVGKNSLIEKHAGGVRRDCGNRSPTRRTIRPPLDEDRVRDEKYLPGDQDPSSLDVSEDEAAWRVGCVKVREQDLESRGALRPAPPVLGMGTILVELSGGNGLVQKPTLLSGVDG